MSQPTRLFWLLAVPVIVALPFFASAAETLTTASVLTEDLRVSSQEKDEVVQRPIVVATTDIRDAQIVAQQGNDITLLFSLYNAQGVQSGIVYGVELYQAGQVVDVVAFNDRPVTLGAGESLPVSLTYHAPAFFSGAYDVWVVAKTASGMPLSLFKVGTVSLQGSAKGVNLTDCSVQVAGEQYLLTSGVDISLEEVLEISCVAFNQSGQPIDIGPQFTSYERSLYGPLVETEITKVQQFTLLPAVETNITFEIPKAEKAQAYDAVLELIDNTGVIVSPKVVAHYVIQGESATVQNVVFDKPSYVAGDVADLLITWSLAADAFSGARGVGTELSSLSLSVAIADKAGTFCSNPTVVSLQNGSTVTQAKVPIVGKCDGPQLLLGISTENGARLAAQSYEYTPVVAQEELKAPTAAPTVLLVVLGIIVAIAGLATVAVKLLTYAIKTRKIPAPVQHYEPTMGTKERMPGITLGALVVSFGLGAGVFLSAGVVPAEALTLNVASGMDTVTFTINTNKATYAVGESVQVFGAAFTAGCGNSIAAGGLEAEDGQGSMQTIGTFSISPYSGFGMFDRTITGYLTPGTKNMLTRAYVQTGSVTNSSLGHLPLTVVCESGTVWNGSSCASTNPQPVATVSGSDCSIAAGESTCVASINWNISNATTPSVRNVTSNTLYSYETNGTNELRTIQHGVNVIAAYDDATTLEATTVTGTCGLGSSWNGSVCEADASPTATISASSCEIPLGANSCGIVLDWNIQSATAPNIHNDTLGVSYAAVAAGTNVPQTIAHGSHNVQARDGLVMLDEAIASAVCESGTVWNGTACAVVTGLGLTLTANDDTVTTTILEGESVTLEWNTTGTVDECVASGDWSGTRVSGGDELIPNISSDRVFTMTCTGPGGTVSDTVSVFTEAPANLMPAGLSLNSSSAFNAATGVYDSLYVQYSVSNNGGVDVGAFGNRLSLDRGADGVYDESIESVTSSGLIAGADSPLFPVYLASNVPFGTHRLRIITDVYDVISEGDEGDNELVVTLTVPVPDPGLEFTAEPAILRSGQSTVLSWDTNVTYPMTCRVRGPQVNHNFNPSVSGAVGTIGAGPLTAKSEFMLQCTEPLSNTTFTKTAWVEVVPAIQEI